MKELWIKKTAWQRHLINDKDVETVKAIVKNLNQENLDLIIDHYDVNIKEEFDDIELFRGESVVDWHMVKDGIGGSL